MTGQASPRVRYGTIDRAYVTTLATTPAVEDRPVWMVNLMQYRDTADYGGSASEKISGRDADNRYAPFESLAAVGAEIVLVADVDQQLLGDPPAWDRVAVVRYPTGRAFLDMQGRPDYREKHVHKEAGLARTIVMATRPVAAPELPADAPEWTEVPHPPAAEDGPVVVMHVLRFHSGGAESDMVDYQNAAAVPALRHGLRIDGWFAVEGTVVGDGRSWDQVRFNVFPSKAAFMEVVLDPARLEAQHDHREAAIADTYTMILRADINHLRTSTEELGRPTG